MRKIAMYDIRGFLLDEFEVNTIVELEQQLNINSGGINACLSGKALTTKSLQFREVINKNKTITRVGDVSHCVVGNSNKRVSKFYKGKYIDTYQNATVASELNSLDLSGIIRCCEGKQLKCGLYTFKYENA